MRFPMIVLFLAVAIVSAHAATAVAQVPPTRFFGIVTVGGELAPSGTEIKGFVNGIECGTTVIEGDDGLYILDVAHTASIGGCAMEDGELVSFTINGAPANQVIEFAQGMFVNVDLSPVE